MRSNPATPGIALGRLGMLASIDAPDLQARGIGGRGFDLLSPAEPLDTSGCGRSNPNIGPMLIGRFISPLCG